MSKRRSAVRTKLPGQAVMLGTLQQRRAVPRVLTCRTAWLTFEFPCECEHVALVKDISGRGIFFYSDLLPDVGEQLNFVVEYLSGLNRPRLHFKGAVVRVEQAAPGSAPGVAVSFPVQGNRER